MDNNNNQTIPPQPKAPVDPQSIYPEATVSIEEATALPPAKQEPKIEEETGGKKFLVGLLSFLTVLVTATLVVFLLNGFSLKDLW